jgi:uroporphyrinogen decarboxylase
MDSRERTFLALNFEEPDRVPSDLWTSSGFERKLAAELRLTKQQLLDRYDIDLRYIPGPTFIGPPLATFADGDDEDIWGVRRQPVHVETGGGSEDYREVACSPLAGATSVDAIEAYDHWPCADWFDYSDIESQCDAIRDDGRVVVFMGDRLNRLAQLKPAMYMRGVEQIFVDMVDSPEIVHAIFRRIRSFYLEYARRIFEAAAGKLDIVLTGDDFGSQNGPLLSPAMWIEYLQEGFSAYTGLARSSGCRVMHHTCGSVRPLIPLMVEGGLDVLQSLQPEAADMAPATLKAEFGDRERSGPARGLRRIRRLSARQIVEFGLRRYQEAVVRSTISSIIMSMAAATAGSRPSSSGSAAS